MVGMFTKRGLPRVSGKHPYSSTYDVWYLK